MAMEGPPQARKPMLPTAAKALMLIGPSHERWDHCFIAEYPSVAAFVEMIRDPVYREAVKHRQAAVEDSRLIRLKPLVPGKTFGEIPEKPR